MKELFALLLLPLTFCFGCDSRRQKAPESAQVLVQSTDEKWQSAAANSPWLQDRLNREKAIEKYFTQHEVAYRWFADFPFGTDDGIPFLILKLLPRIAPEIWGPKENFLDVVGLFNDERVKGYPVARGVGWSGLARSDLLASIDYASFTCGACHIGRVRLDDGRMKYLDGGINAQFNLVRYRVKVVETIQKLIGEEDDPDKKVAKVTAAIIATLDRVHAEDPKFFYHDYTLFGRRFDEAYEAQQVRMFKDKASEVVGKLLVRADLEVRSYTALVDKNYKSIEASMLQGFGGMADATGVSTSFGYLFSKEIMKNSAADPAVDLPPTPGITDFMAVWEQGRRKVKWSSDRSQLIDGGGQWNGNIPIPIFRNLAAELTMGFGASTDVRISAFAEELLEGLPAPVYPFAVDSDLAKQGKSLFDLHCADCHRPNNGRVYKNLGTDLGRAHVVSEAIAQKARIGFTAVGAPGRTVLLPPRMQTILPFAEFQGISLAEKPEFAMMNPKDHDGYNALPLGGVWAQAPFLHNGSVPTVFHLLVPRERPDVFMKSRLDYDKKLLGFSWSMTSPTSATDEGYRFDTKAFPAFSNSGHDKDIEENGKTYRLDWTDDPAGAFAIIEYLKTR